MTSLRPGDVVWVAFPHVETNRVASRPALIVSGALGPNQSLAWAMMITNAERADWPGDVPIVDHLALDLPIPSKIRTEKIATLDIGEARYLGHLAEAEAGRVAELLRGYLADQ